VAGVTPSAEIRARLIPTSVPRSPSAVVLVVHGGRARGELEVSPHQYAVIRMVPIARRIAIAARRRLAVYRMLNSARGWDTVQSPVHDVRWALAELRRKHGDLPAGLVGHSLGGRASLLSGGEASVRSVVALNPWVYPSDDADLTGRRVLIVHGTEDRVASIDRARSVARNLAHHAEEVEFREVPGGGHTMLRHRRVFEGAAARFTAEALL
jgi:predicted esterase